MVPNTGLNRSLVPNPKGGIERIPEFTIGIITYGFPEWGEWRARLIPKGTDKGGRNGPFYIHDSTKGYTHGCVESCGELLDDLINYRNQGNSSIDVKINYTDPTTRGDTFIP